MKKLLATVLCICMIASMSITALAVNPTPSDPTPSDPVPSDPVPSDPVPSDPVPSDPVPSDPTPSDPTPSDPTLDPDIPVNPGPGGGAVGGGSGAPEEEEPTVDIPFVDVEKETYYYDALEWAIENGITEGTSDTTFSPEDVCTRAQMVTFLWRVAGKPTPKSTTHNFTDVDADSYYYTAFLWAVENGITNGTSDTAFSPLDECSRSQMVTFLMRVVGESAKGNDHNFTDVDADAYYYEALLWAVENGITAGTSDTTFSPLDGCTRSQMVTFLYRCFAE